MFSKRGQITAFVIIGIVIVVVLALFLAARRTVFLPTTTESLNQELNEIEDHIIECLSKNSEPNANQIIEKISLQGGYIEPVDDSFILYKDSEVSFLCYNIPEDETCMNRALTINEMEEQISENIKRSLQGCLEVESFSRFKPYDVKAGELNVRAGIEDKSIIVEIEYPVTLTSKENIVSRNKFTESFDYPLGELYQVSQDIIEQEAGIGYFDTNSYMQLKEAKYRIYFDKPYPHKLYIVKRQDNNYVFQFAVEGEPK